MSARNPIHVFPKCWTTPLTESPRCLNGADFSHLLEKKWAVKAIIVHRTLLWQVSVPYAVTRASTICPGSVGTRLHAAADEGSHRLEGENQQWHRHAHAASPESKANSVLADSARNLGRPYAGISREEKLCFLCPVGLKEENLFTKAWKYFITSSRGRSVLMTWSTGLWLAAGFLKLQRAHCSACQPLGQHWDETDKIIVSNEIQISGSTRTLLGPFLPFFFYSFEGGRSILILNLKRETVEVGP